MVATILQADILTKFVYPFLLIFFIIFAVLEKTKVIGDNKSQLNALISFIIGLIFVSAAFPREVLGNLILFLTLAIVIMFVTLVLWGFAAGAPELKLSKGLKTFLMILVAIAVIIAVFWAMGIGSSFFNFLFSSGWSSPFWTNALFVIVIAAALAFVLKSPVKAH